uniref:Uncharacterized protein n=1 Tax=Arundo donax TaxID=35708 RepID=A0A0A9PUQ8_ARUDO
MCDPIHQTHLLASGFAKQSFSSSAHLLRGNLLCWFSCSEESQPVG